MAEENVELSKEQLEQLAKFDPTKPLVVLPEEIEGLEHLTGRFVFKRQTVQDRIKIGVHHAKLRESTEVDQLVDNLAFMVAQFKVVCTEKPSGFEFEEVDDIAVLFGLQEKYQNWVNLFRLKIQHSKANSSTTR